MTVDTITTSQTWTCPTGVSHIDVKIVGGGGGGHRGLYPVSGGDSGDTGALTTENLVAVTPGTGYAIVIGEGGAGGYGAVSPTNGGTTTGFGYSAAGGVGGGGNPPVGWVGGAGVNGDGSIGTSTATAGQDGTGTPSGVGGAAGTARGAGGGGGGGGASSNGNGGAGSAGVVQITYNLPTSTFSGTPTSGSKPLNVQFDGVAGATTYAWTMGDGDTSSNEDPYHTYDSVGTKTVTVASWVAPRSLS